MTLDIVREKTRGLEALRIPPWRASPVLPPDPTDPQRELLRKTYRMAVASALYINRCEGEDRFGKLPNGYMSKAAGLVASGRRHPLQRFPPHHRNGPLIWEEADAAAAMDPAHAAAVHIVASLPGVAPEQWRPMIERFLDDRLVVRGMVIDWAIHARRGEDSTWATYPHVHMVVTARRYRPNMRKGQRQKTWLSNATQLDHAEDAWLTITGLQRLPYLA